MKQKLQSFMPQSRRHIFWGGVVLRSLTTKWKWPRGNIREIVNFEYPDDETYHEELDYLVGQMLVQIEAINLMAVYADIHDDSFRHCLLNSDNQIPMVMTYLLISLELIEYYGGKVI